MSDHFLTLTFRGDQTVSISRESCDLFVDGRASRFASITCRDLLLRIIEASPKIATFEDLHAAVGKKQLTKYVFMIRRDLRSAGLTNEVIKCERNRGYALAENWHLHDVGRSVLGEALEQMKHVVDATCSHVLHCTLTTSPIGLTFLERSPTTQALAHQSFRLLQDASWQLVHELSRIGLCEDHAPDIIEVKVLTERLLSYVTFMRIGHRLSAEDWRKDFVAEVMSIQTRLASDVKRLHAAAVRKRSGGAP